MSILRAMFGPSQSVGDPNNWLLRAIGGGKTLAGTNVSSFTAMTMAAVYCAVGIIADTIGQLPLGVYKKSTTGANLATDHPLYDVLRLQPNPHMNSFGWRQTSQHHVLLWGNGYSEIQRNGKGEALALWPLLPDRTWPMCNTESIDLIYTTSVDGKRFDLDSTDVLQVKAIGFDGYIGYAPLTMMRQAVGMGLAMEEFGAKFFANDAKSGGFLYHPGRLGEVAQKNLEKSMGKEGQGGLDNAHRVKILEEGMKFVQTTIPPEDAQFLGSREFQNAEIARIFRVPLVLLNSHEKTSSFGTGMGDLIMGFVMFTMQSWIEQWEQEMNRKLFTARERKLGLFVRFNLDALLRGDTKSRGAFYTALFNSAAITGNEIRERENFNTQPLLNQFYVSSLVAPVTDPDDKPPAPVVFGAPPVKPAPAKPAPTDDTDDPALEPGEQDS